jgi:F420H(2)-dependent quinone reductase
MIPVATALGPGVTATLDLFPHAVFRAVNSVVVGPFTKRGIGAPPVVGMGTVTVATTGRSSGRAHEVPLAAARLGDTVVVSTVRRNSEWVRNLESDPTTTIWLDGRARQAEASVQRLPGLTIVTLRVNRQRA